MNIINDFIEVTVAYTGKTHVLSSESIASLRDRPLIGDTLRREDVANGTSILFKYFSMKEMTVLETVDEIIAKLTVKGNNR